ncbi:MAG: hypothetical protein HYZ74_07380 [Elusimicrobia bacterium]|nr:hypothetical protein [Elusimicrobiota bacterium]
MDVLVGALGLAFAAALALGGPPRFLPPWVVLFALSLAALARLGRAERAAGRSLWRSRPGASLFLSCLAVYLASFRWHGGDDIPNSMLPFALLRHGTLSFDPLRSWAENAAFRDLIIPVNGRLLSFYPIAPGVLAVPLYVIPAIAGFEPNDPFLHNMAKISGALITAASVVVLLRALEKRYPRPSALAAACLYGFGTFAFSVSSQALYSHGPAQLGVALGLLGILSPGLAWGAASGFGLGLAAISREDSAFFGLALAAYYARHEWKRFPAFAAGAFFPLAFNLAYWRWYGGAFHPPYQAIQAKMFVALDWRAMLAMLVSPSRGLLPYIPAAVFGFWGAARACRDRGAPWAPYLAAACAATWIFYGFRQSWTGGVSFGNRYFSVVAMILAFFTAELGSDLARAPSLRRAWAWTFAASVVIHAVGAFLTWPGVAMTLQEQAATLWRARMHPLAYLFVAEGPLGALAPLPRAAVACATLAAAWPLARLIERR